MEAVTQLSPPPRLVSLKTVAVRYGISKSTLYELIKTDPTFPFKNVGVKKKFMVDVVKFEEWLDQRTERQRSDYLGLATVHSLLDKRGK